MGKKATKYLIGSKWTGWKSLTRKVSNIMIDKEQWGQRIYNKNHRKNHDSLCKKWVDVNENLMKRERIESFLCILAISLLFKDGMHSISLSCVFDIHGYFQDHESVTTGFSWLIICLQIVSFRREGLLSLCSWHKAQAWIVFVK